MFGFVTQISLRKVLLECKLKVFIYFLTHLFASEELVTWLVKTLKLAKSYNFLGKRFAHELTYLK